MKYLLIILLAIPLVSGVTTLQYEPQTQLFAEMEVEEGEQTLPIYTVYVNIENIGDVTARNVQVQLQNVPSDWIYVSDSIFKWASMEAGSAQQAVFELRKGQTDSSIMAEVTSSNAPTITSNIVNIPISMITVIAIIVAIFTMAFFVRS